MFKKITTWIKLHPAINLIILLIIIATALFLLTLSPDQVDPIYKSSPNPSSPSQGFTPPSQVSLDELQLINLSPSPPTFESAWSTDRLYLTFSQPLNQDSIQYQITPSIKSRLFFDSSNPSEFSILPLSGWQANQPYTITVNQGLSTPNHQTLEKDLVITITRTEPKEIYVPNTSI